MWIYYVFFVICKNQVVTLLVFLGYFQMVTSFLGFIEVVTLQWSQFALKFNFIRYISKQSP